MAQCASLRFNCTNKLCNARHWHSHCDFRIINCQQQTLYPIDSKKATDDWLDYAGTNESNARRFFHQEKKSEFFQCAANFNRIVKNKCQLTWHGTWVWLLLIHIANRCFRINRYWTNRFISFAPLNSWRVQVVCSWFCHFTRKKKCKYNEQQKEVFLLSQYANGFPLYFSRFYFFFAQINNDSLMNKIFICTINETTQMQISENSRLNFITDRESIFRLL